MVARCVYCQQFIGDREPLDDPPVTHGGCEAYIRWTLAERAGLVGPRVRFFVRR